MNMPQRAALRNSSPNLGGNTEEPIIASLSVTRLLLISRIDVEKPRSAGYRSSRQKVALGTPLGNQLTLG